MSNSLPYVEAQLNYLGPMTDPTTPSDTRPRESSEVRTLVFHPA